MRLAPEATLRSDRLVVKVWNEMGRPPCFVAGGYLRDRLLGRLSTDLDFSLPGDIEGVGAAARRLAAARRTRPHLLGKAPRAVWRVDSKDLKVELWPLGSLTIDDDILRRDFTCNALVWLVPDGPLIDRVGGLDDLRSGRLRAVSRDNLEDDPLRLLRAARFLAQLDGLELDRRTASFIRELAPTLARAPRARVGNELRLLLASAGAERGLRSLLRLGAFRHTAPPGASPDPAWMKAHTDAVGRLAGSRRHPVPAAVREAGLVASLALLLRGWGCPADEGSAEHSWPRKERIAAGRVARLLDCAIAGVGLDAAGRREIIHVAGADFPVLLAAAAAVDGGDRSATPGWRRWWAQWRRQGERLVSPPELLSFNEIAARSDLPRGPAVGRLLRRLRLAQVRGTVRSASGARRWIAAAAGAAGPGEGDP